LEKAFLCFSARRNLKKLAGQNSIHPALDASHGSRLMFMIFIIMGHRITTFGGHPIFNAETEERVSVEKRSEPNFDICFLDGILFRVVTLSA
jgi:hypothetical protein